MSQNYRGRKGHPEIIGFKPQRCSLGDLHGLVAHTKIPWAVRCLPLGYFPCILAIRSALGSKLCWEANFPSGSSPPARPKPGSVFPAGCWVQAPRSLPGSDSGSLLFALLWWHGDTSQGQQLWGWDEEGARYPQPRLFLGSQGVLPALTSRTCLSLK